jgi:hypothetical protein
VEHIVDVANSRYADREYTGKLPEAGAETRRERRRAEALARVRERACDDPGLADILTALGLDP